METICATGIRVGEVPFITVEAACRGRTDVALKGKVRTIFLPDRLCRRLLQYARKQKIASGEIFLTGGGKRLSRTADLGGDEAAVRAPPVWRRERSFPTICGTCSPGPFTGPVRT